MNENGVCSVRVYSDRCHWALCLAGASLLMAYIVTALAVGSDGSGHGAASSPVARTFTAQDDERAVSVPLGETVVLRLEALPGTGYGWQLVRDGAPQLQLEG